VVVVMAVSLHDVAHRVLEETKPMPMNVHQAVNLHLNSLILECAPTTVRDRRPVLLKFASCLPGGLLAPVKSITVADVEAALGKMTKGSRGHRPVADSTYNLYLTMVRRFFSWAVERKRDTGVTRNPSLTLRSRRIEPPKPKALDLDEAQALIDADLPEYRRWNFQGLAERNALMIHLMLATGLRRAEVAALDWEHVSLKRHSLDVHRGKGSKDRTVPLLEPLVDHLLEYRRENGETTGPVFRTWRGGRLTPAAVYSIFRRTVGPILEKKITPHQARHTYAMLSLDGGIDLPSIQAALGHSNPQTTVRYLVFHEERLKRQYQKHPLNRASE
jgi:integrase